ncbi:WD40 repeat domain-containing serine/threonine protein kinase [Microbispora siamensis]
MAPASALLPGDPQRLGDFWLAGRLGMGGQGVVYEAYDAEGTRVAVKVLHGDAGGDPELRERFGKEAVAARRVASFCTARVLAVDLEAPKPYIVSEYVEGPSLRRAVTEGRRFAGDDLYRLATAVATALAAIHDAGVIHRDLKPDNVLLGPDGPRVIDFGIARTLEMSLTTTGLVTGTPTYMAPEVFMGRRAGAPADVFSWGAIVLYAAAGDDPFHGESLGAVMHRVLSADPDLGVLPDALRPLVARALSKEPGERPTARQLLLALIAHPGGGPADLLSAGSAEARLLGAGAEPDPGLGTLAEEAWDFLGESERDLVPDVFLRLLGVDESGDLVLRALSRDEMLAGRTPEEETALRRILEVFAYLLSRRDGEITLARPALLRAWPRLRAWVDDERDGLPVHAMIRQAAGEWDGRGRREADVLQGGRLETAMRWAATGRRHLRLSPLERDFLDGCEAAARRRARRRRSLTAVLAVLLVLALTGGAVAVWQGQAAVRQGEIVAQQRDQALAGQAATEADRTRTSDPVRAMLLGVAAWRLAGNAQTRAALQNSWTQRERAVFTDPQTSGETIRLLSRDGRSLVSVTPAGVRVHDLRTGRRSGGWDGLVDGGDRLRGADLSPSGRYLAVAAGLDVRVWDMTTGRPTGARHTLVQPDNFHKLEFEEGDRYVGVYEGQGGVIWDTRTGEESTPSGSLTGASFGPGGLVAATTIEHPFVLLRWPGGRPVAHWHDSDSCTGFPAAIGFSPDGRTVLCVRAGRSDLVDVRTRDTVWTGAGADAGGPVRFSPDGRLIALGGETIRLVRAADGATLLTVRAGATTAAFDGALLRYLADDTVVTLDLADLLAPPRFPVDSVSGARFSPDGRLLATHAYDSHELVLWDADRRRRLGTPIRLADPIALERETLAFSGDGRLLAFVDGLGGDVVRVWDTRRHAEVGRVTLTGELFAKALAMNADGTLLVVSAEGPQDERTGENTERLLVRDVRRGRWIKSIDVRDETSVVFRPGTAQAALLDSTADRLIDLSTGRPYGPALGSWNADGLDDAAFSPDGRILAAASGTLTFWDLPTGRRRGPVFRITGSGISRLLFSPRGDPAAAVLGDGTVQLWDAATPGKLGVPIPGRGRDLATTAFTADGTAVQVLDDTGRAWDVPVDPDRVAAAVCARAGRTLTGAEWRAQFPGVPYRDVCAAGVR